MEIKTLKELREVLNSERSRWKISQINGFFGWMRADLYFVYTQGVHTNIFGV